MAQTVAEILVDQMVEVGIRKVYGIVGDSANPIVDALRRHESDIEFIHVRNEEAGAFAAGADAQVSGRPTAVLGSSGPGSLHLVNGLYDCQRNGAPVFAIATHIPSTEIGSDYFQETNPEQIFSGCTHYCALVSNAGQMPRISELALQAAILERGVGMVIVPGDVAAQTVDRPMLRHPVLTDRPLIRPDDGALDKTVALIAGAKKIVIHGGEGTRQARAEVLRLSETLKAPISYAFRGKDVLEADNPSAVGMTGLLGWGGATGRWPSATCSSCSGRTSPTTRSFPMGRRSSRSTTSHCTSDGGLPWTSVWSATWERPCARSSRGSNRAPTRPSSTRSSSTMAKWSRESRPTSPTREAAKGCGRRWWRPR